LKFETLGLDPTLLKAVDASGFKAPTEIQRQAIPVVLAGRDLMASAQTGTGKTAAFVLPALQRLLRPSTRTGKGPRVLVLTPTRELALQVSQNISQFGRHSDLISGNLVGGMPYPPQERMLRKPLDLLVATPGRLLDHMNQGRIDFSRLEILVLDEADRMLDMGFVDAVRTVAAALPAARQTLLFSATLEGKVLRIANDLLTDPARLHLASNRDHHAMITQRAYRANDAGHKRRLLSHYLAKDELTQALVFTATKRGAQRMARTLDEQGHSTAALHGDMSQAARKRTVDSMRRGKIRILVATDVAARGLDIRGISHVINFDMPMVAEDYIHRIGRTGRAESTGTAISLVAPADRSKLVQIERLTGEKLQQGVIAGLEPGAPGAAPASPDKPTRPARKRGPERWRSSRPAAAVGAGPAPRSKKGNGDARKQRGSGGKASTSRRRGGADARPTIG
jgi:superfamily II DNA/RNA helicase